MHKTVYIDVDEEIIGIISKIKKIESDEVFLVVPKNSLLTQGIVNLKLLKKETEKMGKNIILVTSDDHSRKIIKNLGFKTKNKSVHDFIDNGQGNQENISERKIKSEEFSLETSKNNPKKREIGSSSFYNDQKGLGLGQETEEKSEKPEMPIVESPFGKEEPRNIRVNTENSFGSEHIKNYEAKNKKEQQKVSEQKFEQAEKSLDPDEKSKSPSGFNLNRAKPENSIDDFYSSKKHGIEDDFIEVNSKSEKNKKPTFKISNKKKFAFFLILIFALILLSAGFWSYSNWPKMKIELFSKEEIKESTLNLKICENQEVDENCLKGNYKKLIVRTVESYESSGEEFSNDKGMARGIVKIYNNYSSKSQPLVATTRILSENGKLFRLIKSVTVPGMEDDQPGVAEAQVISDEIGQSYNIGPSKFTIEGFKGGDKYEKFEVISEFSMVGGANDTDNKKVKVVTGSDIDLAREKTIEVFNNKLEDNIREQLDSEEIFVVTSIEKELVKSDSSYAPGDIINKFNYIVEEKIKLMAFDEDKFNQEIRESFQESSDNKLEFNKISKIDFQKDIANYEEKFLDLVINAKASYWPKINTEEMKKQLGSKNNEEIKKYLTDLNQIQKAVISYSPSWLSALPVKQENIIIEEVQ